MNDTTEPICGLCKLKMILVWDTGETQHWTCPKGCMGTFVPVDESLKSARQVVDPPELPIEEPPTPRLQKQVDFHHEQLGRTLDALKEVSRILGDHEKHFAEIEGEQAAMLGRLDAVEARQDDEARQVDDRLEACAVSIDGVLDRLDAVENDLASSPEKWPDKEAPASYSLRSVCELPAQYPQLMAYCKDQDAQLHAAEEEIRRLKFEYDEQTRRLKDQQGTNVRLSWEIQDANEARKDPEAQLRRMTLERDDMEHRGDYWQSMCGKANAAVTEMDAVVRKLQVELNSRQAELNATRGELKSEQAWAALYCKERNELDVECTKLKDSHRWLFDKAAAAEGKHAMDMASQHAVCTWADAGREYWQSEAVRLSGLLRDRRVLLSRLFMDTDCLKEGAV